MSSGRADNAVGTVAAWCLLRHCSGEVERGGADIGRSVFALVLVISTLTSTSPIHAPAIAQTPSPSPTTEDEQAPQREEVVADAPPILAEQASSTDLVWTSIPKDFVLRIGRDTVDGGGERVGLVGDLKGDDRPGSVLRLGQARGNQRQELRLEGLAPKWAAKFRYEGSLPNPRELVVDISSSVRHTGDVIRLSNFSSGILSHRFLMRGNADTATGSENPSKADAILTSITEALVLRYKRVRDAGGDVAQVVNLTNQRVIGGLDDREARPNLDGRLIVELRNGGPSEIVNFSDLPAQFRLAYDRPPVTTGGRPNCLGQLAYSATSNTLDFVLRAFLNRGCAQGRLAARVQGMPTQGFSVAKIHPDGNGRIQVAGGETVPEMTVQVSAPDDMRQFVNKDISLSEQFCKPFNPGPDLGCSHITIRATPQYDNLRFRIGATQLQDVTIATNIDSDGNADPYPGSSNRFEDRELWRTVPLMAIRNQSPGHVVARLTGDDVDGQQAALHQEVQCCTRPVKTANHSMDYDLDRPLDVRFYTWFVRQGSCSGPRGSGSDPRKCNSNGEELRDEFGQNIHCGIPPFEEPIPFAPRFNYFRDFNALTAFSGETMYFVPNLHDLFMSEPNPNGAPYRWAARNLSLTCQTDWYFASLLREYEPDLLANALASL